MPIRVCASRTEIALPTNTVVHDSSVMHEHANRSVRAYTLGGSAILLPSSWPVRTHRGQVKNRGRPPTSPILPGALRLAVASLIATVACSGSLGGLGGGTGDGGAPLLPGNGSSSASVGSGVTVSSSLASSSSSGGSAASEGSSSSGSSTAAAATATTTAQSSNGSSGSSSSSSSGSSSSTNAADASVAPDARADAADAAVLSFATDVYPIIAARCIRAPRPPPDSHHGQPEQS